MGMRRSLRIQTREVKLVEKDRKALSNLENINRTDKMPRKRKVKKVVTLNTTTVNKENRVPRRSLRIKKKKIFYSDDEELLKKEKNKSRKQTNEKENSDPKSDKVNEEKQKIEARPDNLNIREIKVNIEKLDVEDFNDDSEEINVDDRSSQTDGDERTEAQAFEENEKRIKLEKEEEACRNAILEEEIKLYKLSNHIDFNEVINVARSKEFQFADFTPTETSEANEQNVIINDVFLNDTNRYIFKSCFKDKLAVIAGFDRHSGQITTENHPYDIKETSGNEKVKRFYRKNINDPRLNSWYQYNVLSSTRFSPKKNTEQSYNSSSEQTEQNKATKDETWNTTKKPKDVPSVEDGLGIDSAKESCRDSSFETDFKDV